MIAEENEERSMIEPHSREDPKLKELIKVIFPFTYVETKTWLANFPSMLLPDIINIVHFASLLRRYNMDGGYVTLIGDMFD